jgi:hypothetical protein
MGLLRTRDTHMKQQGHECKQGGTSDHGCLFSHMMVGLQTLAKIDSIMGLAARGHRCPVTAT